jgi:hypothetical protein
METTTRRRPRWSQTAVKDEDYSVLRGEKTEGPGGERQCTPLGRFANERRLWAFEIAPLRLWARRWAPEALQKGVGHLWLKLVVTIATFLLNPFIRYSLPGVPSKSHIALHLFVMTFDFCVISQVEGTLYIDSTGNLARL